MNVLMVASECFPLVKTGGLADVVGALPGALQALGCDARVMLPNYPAVARQLREPRVIDALDDLFGAPASLIAARSENGLEIVALDAPQLYDRPGNPYLGPDGRDWSDNHRRFAALPPAPAPLAAPALAGQLERGGARARPRERRARRTRALRSPRESVSRPGRTRRERRPPARRGALAGARAPRGVVARALARRPRPLPRLAGRPDAD